MQFLKWIGLVVLILGGAVVVIALLGASLPVKHTATCSATFKVTPQQVWDVVSGPPTWRPDITRYQELPTRDGHRMWIEYGKGDSKMTYEVLESNPPRKLVTRIADPHLPFGGTWTYEITPAGDGSTLTITENGEVYNPIFRFISRYVMGYTATNGSLPARPEEQARCFVKLKQRTTELVSGCQVSSVRYPVSGIRCLGVTSDLTQQHVIGEI